VRSEPGIGQIDLQVREVAREGDGRICLMGGGELAQALIAAGLVDEIGVNVHPILLGSGIPVFRDTGRRVKLALTECRPLDGGCVFASYRVLHA
jgi:dihydrofolate reductase